MALPSNPKVKDIILGIKALENSKQDALESGTNIKTLSGNSLLGSGDLPIRDYLQLRLNATIDLTSGNDTQITGFLTAGENINNNSLILDTTNRDKVTIGAGVSIIKVTSVIQYMQKTDVTRFGNSIKKNGNDAAYRGSYVGLCSDLTGTTLASNQRRVVVLNVSIFEVSQGDKITFVARSTGSTSSTNDQITSTDGQTHFIIEVIK